eukprot:Tbor_TRINITY_DN5589_c1_g5::TRINITY_DN5589_c1_g5_i1::g.12998::m.12998
MLSQLPGKGVPVQRVMCGIPKTSLNDVCHASTGLNLFTLMGVVCDPKVNHRRGYMQWQCTVSHTHQGLSGTDGGLVVDTQLFDLKCQGEWYNYCRGIPAGHLVLCRGRIFHRPRYVAANASYDYRTEIIVSDNAGSISVLT